MSADAPLGVYISVPFCKAKCSFCNFASGVGSAERMDAYVSLLCAEIANAPRIAEQAGGALPQAVDTLYFGGGTPSLLSPQQLDRIFTAIRDVFHLSPTAEITLEAAPGQIADDTLQAAQQLGVNRISLGVQSFIDREAQAVGRSHTGASCLAEITRLRTAGIAEVCADLIAGLPYQTPKSWQFSLDAAVGSGLTHTSVYMLEVDEDSRLGLEVLNNGPRFHAPAVPADELSAALYEQACTFLEERGFPLYEISNFAATPHQSRHNRKYWQRQPYIGFGLDAHSMLLSPTGAVRFANAEELAAYGSQSWGGQRVLVDQAAAFEEAIFLGLRLREGASVDSLTQQFGESFVGACEPSVCELAAGGLMQIEAGRWMLTTRGRMVSSEVFGRILESTAVAA